MADFYFEEAKFEDKIIKILQMYFLRKIKYLK
jgi:hypothetical protein